MTSLHSPATIALDYFFYRPVGSKTMKHVLALIRLLAMAGVSLFLLPFALGAWCLAWCTGPRGRARALRFLPHITSAWARALLFLFGIRVTLPDKRPARAGMITSNHLSYVDILVIASIFPSRFIAKKEIASWPVIGLLTRSVGTLYLNRGRSSDLMPMGEEIQKTLDAGISVVLFPEGGCSDGTTVQPFFGGLLEVAVRKSIECLPVCLHYEIPDRSLSPASVVCWAGNTPLLSPAWQLLCLGRSEATVRWSSTVPASGDRKELTARLHRETLAVFTPIRQETEKG